MSYYNGENRIPEPDPELRNSGSTGGFIFFLIIVVAFFALTLFGCTTRTVYQPQIVKVPVAACPRPAPIPAPHEYVYGLDSNSSPDAVAKSAEATIKELEDGVAHRNAVLDGYRQPAKK